METIRKIRLALSKGMGIREAARQFNKARKTIRKIARGGETSFTYHRKEQGYPALYAGQIRFYADSRLIAEHPRVFGQDKTLCDPLHCLPVLERKPGALRNGRPFRDWALAPGLQSLREALARVKGGDRQLAGVLSAIPRYGEEAVSVACELALEAGLTSKDAVLNILCRTTEEAPARDIAPPGHLRLSHPPQANCAGYERLLEVAHDA